MDSERLADRLDEIEYRLGRIEAKLQLPPVEAPEAAPIVEPIAPALEKARIEPSVSPQIQAPLPWQDRITPPPITSTTRSHHSPLPIMSYRTPEKHAPAAEGALERTIGLKWTAWVGAIVLVIGAGYGIKFAYDRGWFGGVPPAVRLTLMALTGFLLIGIGEWVYRKINSISATGLFGAGVAVLFLVSYAGHAYYGLYERNTAFIFMAVATLVGAAVAMRGNLVSIAVLSLLGGNLAPLLLQGDQSNVIGFLSYLLMLQVVALTLAWWGGHGKWWTLRGLSLGGKTLWIATLLTSPQFGSSTEILPFILIFAAFYQLELILSERRQSKQASKTGLNFSLMVTTALTIAILYYFRDATDALRTMWVLGLAGINGILAIALSRQGSEAKAVQSLSLGYAIQSVALLAVAVPVALSGIWIVAGWGILSLAFGLVGMWFDLPLARHFAGITWFLAIAQIGRFTQDPKANADKTWLTIAGQTIPAYAVMSWLMTISGHLTAFLIKTGIRNKDRAGLSLSLALFVSVIASIIWIAATLSALPPLGATAWIVLYAWFLVISDFVLPDLFLLSQAAAILALTTVKWIAVDTLAARLEPGWMPGTQWPLLTPSMGTGVLIAASILGIYRLRRVQLLRLIPRTSDATSALLVLIAVVGFLLGFGFSIEIDRIVERSVRISALVWPAWQFKQMAWTMLWLLMLGIFAGAAAKIETRDDRRAHWLGWVRAGIVILAFKYVVVDSLLFRLWDGPNTAAAVFNTQLLAGFVAAGSLLFIRTLSKDSVSGSLAVTQLSSSLSFGASLIVLWAGTLEIDRLVERFASPGAAGFPLWQWKQLLWTAWWMLGISAYLLGTSWFGSHDPRRRVVSLNAYWSLPILLAVKYIIVDTAFWRMTVGPALAPLLANVSLMTAAVVLGGLMLLSYLSTQPGIKEVAHPRIRTLSTAGIILVLLWTGSLEIDRVFQKMVATSTGPFADPALAEQVAMSIFWSVFALLSIVVGFSLRAAGLRYFALALFAVTLLKVFVIDMSQVSTGYRVLSFIGLGGLLLGTSVLYGKLSPLLLHEKEQVPL